MQSNVGLLLRRNATSALVACREIEMAMNQATTGSNANMYSGSSPGEELSAKSAQDQLRRLKVTERNLENELANAEAAFAQEQLLEFIKEKKYALHPFNLANAMAGLPYATGCGISGRLGLARTMLPR